MDNELTMLSERRKIAVLYEHPKNQSLRTVENCADRWIDEDGVLHLFMKSDGAFTLHPPAVN